MSKYTMADHHDTYFTSVASYDSEQSDTVVPNGETWLIVGFTGSAAQVPGTVVKLIWDPAGANETIAATHGDVSMVLAKPVTGDGSKKVRILLENDTGNVETIGGQWEAQGT